MSRVARLGSRGQVAAVQRRSQDVGQPNRKDDADSEIERADRGCGGSLGEQHPSCPSPSLGCIVSRSSGLHPPSWMALAMLSTGLFATADAHQPEGWRDPSRHRVRLVAVDDGVELEVLDWGGSGRPVVLLAGSGNTAHVFDDFAPKLTDCCRVYGITRRGYGASTRPSSGYDEQRRADDILHILDSLKIDAPVLVGHSMAGGELTTLGNQNSKRLAGLVFLDALGDPTDFPSGDPAYMELFNRLPAPMRGPSSPPSEEEASSFSGYRAWQVRNEGFAFPESELRNGRITNPGRTMGGFKTPTSVDGAIAAGGRRRDYSEYWPCSNILGPRAGLGIRPGTRRNGEPSRRSAVQRRPTSTGG
ncbi:MAG: alpha/beta hydrolase [Chloroflexi bacterium]|nr:MAG: alpha/beta hydrolase [Chloroflexota bacterium]